MLIKGLLFPLKLTAWIIGAFVGVGLTLCSLIIIAAFIICLL